MNEPLRNTQIRETLLDDGAFAELLAAFVDRSVEECSERHDDQGFESWYRMAVETHVDTNSMVIDSFQESPIEKIFLRSLLLGFVKAEPFGLVVHQFGHDALEEVEQFRLYYQRFSEFLEWWENRKTPWTEIESYLDSELEAGKMDERERDYLRHLTFRYHYLRMQDSIHLTIQPNFPQIKINNRGIRPDLYFWSPKKESFGLIVECDGFQYHSSREAFANDRRRDRVLATKGLQTLRFSGTEITNNPIGSTKDILEMLWQEQDAWEA